MAAKFKGRANLYSIFQEGEQGDVFFNFTGTEVSTKRSIRSCIVIFSGCLATLEAVVVEVFVWPNNDEPKILIKF